MWNIYYNKSKISLALPRFDIILRYKIRNKNNKN